MGWRVLVHRDFVNPTQPSHLCVYVYCNCNRCLHWDRIDGIIYFLGVVVNGLMYGNYVFIVLFYSWDLVVQIGSWGWGWG